MKTLALLLNLGWITALIVLIKNSTEGFEFKKDYVPIVLFSFIGIVFLNFKAFKRGEK